MRVEKSKRLSKPAWQNEIRRLISVAKFTVVARRVVLGGLIIATIGIVLGHFWGVPPIQLRWAVIFFIAFGLGVEIFWKCFSAYCVGTARADWSKRRTILIDACGGIATALDNFNALTVGEMGSWFASVREAVPSVSGGVQSVLTSVKNLDKVLARLDDLIGSTPFVDDCSETLSGLPKIWERFSVILPGKVQREVFDPAFNEMLVKYIQARRFLGKSARRWLAFAFTMCALLIVLDCIRLMLTSGAVRIVLNVLPESFRAWWRRHNGA